MKTAEQIKTYTTSNLRNSLLRPGMYSACVHDLEILYQTYFDLLSFIDENQEDSSIEAHYIEYFRKSGFWASRGVRTPFLSREINEKDMVDGVSIVYAQAANYFGYTEFQRTLLKDEFQEIYQWCRNELQHRDWQISEIVDRFGEPSFSTNGRHKKAYLYSTNENKHWIGFLFSNTCRELSARDNSNPSQDDDTILYCSFMPGDKPCSSRFLWSKYAQIQKDLKGIQK